MDDAGAWSLLGVWSRQAWSLERGCLELGAGAWSLDFVCIELQACLHVSPGIVCFELGAAERGAAWSLMELRTLPAWS